MPMEEIEAKRTSSARIDVLVGIDTEYVKRMYPNPSRDKSRPTAIDHNSQSMIVTGSRGVLAGQGTADLNFKAFVGDEVVFRSNSICENSDDAVILYGIGHRSGAQVFTTPQAQIITRNRTVMPYPQYQDSLPPSQQGISVVDYQANVRQSGTENLYVNIALYTLSENDGQTQELFGYFYWDPTITVVG